MFRALCLHLILVHLSATSLLAWPPPPNEPSPPQASGAIQAGPEDTLTVYLPQQEDARDFAQQVLNEIRGAAKPPKVRIFHLSDSECSDKLITVVQILSQAGISVEGTCLSGEDFKALELQLRNQLPSSEQLEAFLLKYERNSGTLLTKAERTYFLKYFSPRFLLKKINHFKNRLFGLPNGITFLKHFTKKDPLTGKRQWRFKPDGATTRLAALVTAGGVVNLAATMLAKPIVESKQNLADIEWQQQWVQWQQLMQSPDFLITNAMVGVWVMTFMTLQREVSSFKNQGTTVWVDPNAPAGEQIKTDHNRLFFGATSVGQEILLSALITLAVAGPSRMINPTILLNFVVNGFLGAVSYFSAERWRTSLILKAEEAAERGDTQLARKLFSRMFWITLIWWDALFPLMKNSQLLLTGLYDSPSAYLIAAPMVVVGLTSLFIETYWTGGFRLLTNKVRQLFGLFSRQQKRACEDLLILQPGGLSELDP